MTTAVKVGIFMTLALVVLAFLILRVEDVQLFGPQGRRIDAVFDSVAGLDDKASVRIAGVRVGRVDGVGLDGRRARVSLLLEQPLALTVGTSAAVSSLGLLGEKYVEILPGPAGAPPLPEGAVLEGSTPMTFDQAMAKLSAVADSIQGVTGSLTGAPGGDGQETPVSRMIANLEATSADIRALIAAHREEVGATVRNFERFSATLAAELPRLTHQLERVLGQVDTVVAENREDLRGSLGNIRELTDRLQVSVDNLNQISTKIASGEGTLGKLVQSGEAHDELMATLGSIEVGVGKVSDTLGRIGKVQLDLGVEGSYFQEPSESRTAFAIDVDPQSGRFYHVAAVDDPRGRVRTKRKVETVTGPDGVPVTTTTETVTTEDKVTLSAQFGFRFGQARLRAGLFESTGGAAIDYGLLDRRLWLSLEAFDFGREELVAGVERDVDPRLRLTTRWFVHPNLYLVGGYDDFLVPERDSLLFGAGVRWRDDDLKYLLGSIPRF